MLKIISHYNLAPLTTFQIGGPAQYFAVIKKKTELKQAFSWARKNNLELIIIGGGSNVLANDKGVRGLVIKLENGFYQIDSRGFISGAGLSLPLLVQLAGENGFSGLEWAIGIPGTVGGAVFGNAGAYGSQIADIVSWVEIYDSLKHKFKKTTNRQCGFSYRQSIFMNKPEWVIWQVKIILKKAQPDQVKTRLLAIKNKRARSTPLKPSAGCAFKNINSQYLKGNNPALYLEAKEKKVIKNNLVPAGWIIDKAGLKGKKIGQAQISPQHANFIINLGGATAEQVIMLISFIKQQVRNRFNIQLLEEIKYLGF